MALGLEPGAWCLDHWDFNRQPRALSLGPSIWALGFGPWALGLAACGEPGSPELGLEASILELRALSPELTFFNIENGSPKRPFVAAWGGARLDKNRDFRTDGAQQGSTDINPVKVRNHAKLSKYIGPGTISYKLHIPIYL